MPWRAETFAALERAAAYDRWPGYTRFASLLEQGLRKDALVALRQFAQDMAARPIDARWELVCWIFMELATPGVVIDAIVPFPLKVDVVLPTLREMRATDPEAILWMTTFFVADLFKEQPADPDPRERVLRDGLARFPSEPRLARALAAHLVAIVEDHVRDSYFRGDPDDDLARLAEARALAGPAADIDRAERLIAEWRLYRAAGADDFHDWCRDRGLELPIH